jgi:deoxyhypusine monooxygenase
MVEVNYQYLEDSLCNTSGNVSLAERFRSLFTLKNLANDQAIDIIGRGMKDNIYKYSITHLLYVYSLEGRL